ncbi:MAG: Ig-like domain-containing protein [Coprobacillus sp.]
MKTIVRKCLVSLLVMMMVVTTITQFPINVSAKDSDTTIYLNSDNVITNNFEGFGVQWDPSDLYSYTDTQWDSFVEKAKFLKPNIMRVMLHDGDSYCIGFDESKNPIYDWESPLMERTYKILDFAEENNVPIMLGEWRSISERGFLSYDETGKQVSWDNPIWANMIVDCLDYLINEKGYTCIKYYNMVNEPNYYKRDHPEVTDQQVYDAWKTAIKNLRAEMIKTGDKKITDLKIVGPDVYDGQEAWIKQTASADLKDYIDVTEIHRYAPLDEVKSGRIEEKLISWRELAETLDPEVKQEGFGIGEMGLSGTGPGDCQLGTRNYAYGVDIFDYALQATRAGMKFGSVWGFEDSMHLQATDVVTTYKDKYGPAAKTEEGKQYKVHTPTGDPNIDNDIKIWGFWNELAEEMSAQNSAAGVTGRANTVKASDENIRPWYYTWSMICRYFPKDSQVISASNSRINGLRASAVIIPSKENKNDISIAAVNSSNEDRTVTLSVPNATTPMDLTQYFYYDGEINGKTRPQTSKSEVLPYDTLKNCDLSKGVQVELPARTALILTTLGYNGENNPVSMTTGEKPAAQYVELSAESNIVELNKQMKMNAVVEPDGADTDIEWSVTDYFGKSTDKATITQDGILTMTKVGQIKVVAKSKTNPQAVGSIDMRGTKTSLLIDKLQDVEGETVAKYQGVVRDDNSANFGGVKTIKRKDSNANGIPGVITYQADGIYKAKLNAYSLNTNLATSGNFVVEVSKNNTDWIKVSMTATQGAKANNWYPYTFETTDIDKSENYQYLRVTLKSGSSYKTYDPQYAGGEISFGEESASNVIIETENKIVAKNQELKLSAKVDPTDFSQEVVWDVCDKNGDKTSLATISQDGVLNAKESGQVVVIATTKNGEMSAYQTIDIVNGYFVDDIKDFSNMYQYGDFTFEKADSKKFEDATIIKRLTDTNQPIVYALPDIEKVEFEIYKNSNLDSGSVDIYTSKDGIYYQKIDKIIKDVGKAASGSEYTKFKVSSKAIVEGTNFVKLELKNDEKIYSPSVGKTEIIYNENLQIPVKSLSIDQKLLSVHINENANLNVKVAPLTSKPEIVWESQDPSIATVDKDGKVTGIKAGSTIIYAKYDDKIYTSSAVNVLSENLAIGKSTRASSDTNNDAKNPTKALANDGKMNTRWASKYGTTVQEYLEIDLGSEQFVDNVKLFWEGARAKDFNIEVSLDGVNYTVVKELRSIDGKVLTDDISFGKTKARYVKMNGLVPVTKYGYSLYEFEVYNNTELKKVDNIQFKDLNSELYVGEKTLLDVTVNPHDATYKTPIYSSSNTDIIYCKNNELIALKEGKAIITATVDGKEISQEITVVKENARKIAGLIKEDDIQISNGKLVLPDYEGYTVSVASSDIEKIIGKDGIINQPVETTKVEVVLNVKEKTKSRSAIVGTNTAPFEMTIEGSKDKYKELLTLIKDVILIKEDDYTKDSVKNLKDQLICAYQVMAIDNLLVKEVEEAYNQLQKAYTSLQKNIVINPEEDNQVTDKPSDNNKPSSNVVTSDMNDNDILGCVVIVILSAMVFIVVSRKKKDNL